MLTFFDCPAKGGGGGSKELHETAWGGVTRLPDGLH